MQQHTPKSPSERLPAYYKAKQEATNLIKTHLEKGIRRATLHYLVFEKYGFGKKIVEDYLKMLEQQGFLKTEETEDGEVVSWK